MPADVLIPAPVWSVVSCEGETTDWLGAYHHYNILHICLFDVVNDRLECTALECCWRHIFLNGDGRFVAHPARPRIARPGFLMSLSPSPTYDCAIDTFKQVEKLLSVEGKETSDVKRVARSD